MRGLWRTLRSDSIVVARLSFALTAGKNLIREEDLLFATFFPDCGSPFERPTNY